MDAQLFNHGSIWLLFAASEVGEAWITDNIGEDAQRFGHGVVIEPRYVEDIAAGMVEDGLTVE